MTVLFLYKVSCRSQPLGTASTFVELNYKIGQHFSSGFCFRWSINLKATEKVWRLGLEIVSWCFQPSQSLGTTSGLKTNSNPSLTYSAHKSLNINQNVFTATYFTHTHAHTCTHTHAHTHTEKIYTHKISTEPKHFYITVEVDEG